LRLECDFRLEQRARDVRDNGEIPGRVDQRGRGKVHDVLRLDVERCVLIGVPKYRTVPWETTNSRDTGPTLSRYLPRAACRVPLTRYRLRRLVSRTEPAS